MQHEQPEQLVILDIDVQQWRRDIQTFVDSTIKELQAINDELSSGFANGQPAAQRSPVAPVSNSGLPSGGDPDPNTTADQNDIRSKSLLPFTETQTDDRLAALKRKLAQRVSDPDSNHRTLQTKPGCTES